MKNLKYYFAATLAIGIASIVWLSAAPPVSMQPANGVTTAFNGFGVSNATPLSYFIASAAPAGVARVQQISAYSDKATANILAYYSTNSGSCTQALSGGIAAGTNTIWGNGFTNFAANDIIVVRYTGSNTFDFYERNKVSGTPTSSNLVLTWVSAYPLNYGDTVYKMVAGAKYPLFSLTNVNVSATGGAIFYGQEATPLLIEVDATTSGSIYNVVGDYWRRPRYQ